MLLCFPMCVSSSYLHGRQQQIQWKWNIQSENADPLAYGRIKLVRVSEVL